FNGFLFNILMIAIIPGIGEEFLFRGVLLRLLKEWTKNIHWAVFISAVLFSAFHLQFYGFLPRLMLGILLGYMFVWTGSIWVPIFIHFINNAAAVIFVYIVNKSKLETNLESFGATDNLWLIIGSFLIVAVLLTVIYKKRGNIQNDISSH
ncbi:MAG: CPBP family intramembrane metalloprotease, partial [Bacteroidales bacterium]|nr:CPBP family intramembrane metalloprotease [Bacteroidales bacterium]